MILVKVYTIRITVLYSAHKIQLRSSFKEDLGLESSDLMSAGPEGKLSLY